MAKKPPIIPVDSGPFEVEVDGEKYNPHEGEFVTFKTRGSVDTMMTYMRLVNMLKVEENEDGESTTRLMDELGKDGLFADLLDYLSTNVLSWTWTDQSGNAYENPPSVATLKTLEFPEVFWLMSAQSGNSGKPVKDDEAKNE